MTRAQWSTALAETISDFGRGILAGAFWVAVAFYLSGAEMIPTFLDIAPSLLLFLFPYFGIVLALNVAKLKGDMG